VETLTLESDVCSALRGSFRRLPNPYESVEEFLLAIYPVFAKLPPDILRRLFAFRNSPESPGALLLKNAPVDIDLPRTPPDGKRSNAKASFYSEACLLGIGGILGEPLGYQDERGGELVHDLCPVQTEATATSSESSQISLGFHTDFNFDKDNPRQPFNVINPDFVLLVCLRADVGSEASTMYADARAVCSHLTTSDLELLRQPLFRFAASYSFTGKCGSDRIWSVPCPILKGPERYPEISIDLLCGVQGVTAEAEAVLERIRALCSSVAENVFLTPGDLLLMDNRKGMHARSAFQAHFDGSDRWLQRVYVRRSLWELRRPNGRSLRVF
jgi:L-asparagine oxygenase